MTDNVSSTTVSEDIEPVNLKNKLKMYSLPQITTIQSPPKSSPATDFIDQLHADNNSSLKDSNLSCDNR